MALLMPHRRDVYVHRQSTSVIIVSNECTVAAERVAAKNDVEVKPPEIWVTSGIAEWL